MGLPVVAVINTSEDVANALSEALRDDGQFEPAVGYVVDFRKGRDDLGDFMRRHDPVAIIWDIAIPYDVNWDYFCSIRALPECAERPFVLTTTNLDALAKLVGEKDILELVGKPYDLALIVDAVHRAVTARARTANGPRHV